MKRKIVKALAMAMAGFILSTNIQVPADLTGMQPSTLVAQAATDTAGFINKVGPLAVKDMKESGILASVTIAQAILESGWGESRLAKDANNYFGIKASAGWQGGVTNMATEEYDKTKGYYTIVDGFRKYSELSDSIKDHSEFLLVNSRYKGVQYVTDPQKAITLIWNAGYATAPNYVDLIMKLIKDYNLTRFDQQALAELEKEKQELALKKEQEEASRLAAEEEAKQALEEEARLVAEESARQAQEAVEEVSVKELEVEKKVEAFETSAFRSAKVEAVKEPEPDKNTVSSQDEELIPAEEIKEDKPVIDAQTGEAVSKEDVEEANKQEVSVSEVLDNKEAPQEAKPENTTSEAKVEEPKADLEENAEGTFSWSGSTDDTDIESRGMAIAYMDGSNEESPALDSKEDSEEAKATEESHTFSADGISVESMNISPELGLKVSKVDTSLDLAYDITFANAQEEVQELKSIDATVRMTVDGTKRVDRLFFVDKEGRLEDITSQLISQEDGVVVFKVSHFSTYGVTYAKAEENNQTTPIEETKPEDTKVEDAKVEDTKVEEAKVEDTKVEDTKVEDAKAGKSSSKDVVKGNKSSSIKPKSTSHTNLPKAPRTGDFANYLVYIVIAILCLGGLGFVVFSGKKKSGKRK